MKVLLDTNVLLDIVEKREPYFTDSFKVFLKSATKDIEAIIGAGSVTDIYYIARKNCKDANQALLHIVDLLKVVFAVDTKASDIQDAMKLDFTDFEDAVVASTAAREKVDYIITRNTGDYRKSVVSAISPSDFLRKHFVV